MKLQKKLLDGIESFLGSVSPKIVKRGGGYFARGDIDEVQCLEANRRFSTIVRGGTEYSVTLEFGQDSWVGECVLYPKKWTGGDGRIVDLLVFWFFVGSFPGMRML